MGRANYDEWREAIRDLAVVRTMLADYRAGLTIDLRHEEADRVAGRRILCPTTVLWSAHDDLIDLYGDPAALWNAWAADIRSHSIDSSHHMAEEAPDALAAALLAFLEA
jgi:haloacetate dehalogenase